MHKKDLLRSVAESGYNIGYGAKLHFSTFDIVEKAPGWVGCISLVIGVFALIYPPLAENWVSAALVLGSVLALYINFYNADKSRYEEAGIALTRAFHKLRILYAEVSGCNDDANLAAYVARHEEILASASSVGITKQIFLANWYAHLKFFWEHQIAWVDNELHFKFFRDKLPFGVWVLFGVTGICVVAYIAHKGLPSVLYNWNKCPR